LSAVRIGRHRTIGGIAAAAAVALMCVLALAFRIELVTVPDREMEGPLKLEDPAVDGTLPPIYHLEDWRVSHPQEILRGDFEEVDFRDGEYVLDSCFECHAAEKYCNKCHSYVGARRMRLRPPKPEVPEEPEER